MAANTDDTRQDLLDLKLRTEVRKMMVDMEHDAELRTHWRHQKLYWTGAVLLAVVAIMASPFLKAMAKHYYP